MTVQSKPTRKPGLFLALGGGLLLACVACGLVVSVVIQRIAGPHGPVTGITPTPTGAVFIPIQGGSGAQAASSGGQADDYNLSLHLSEGRAQPQAVQSAPLADGQPLSPEEIAQILARLPALTPAPGDQVDFRLPTQPIPPPRTGETVQQNFPPPEPVATPEPEDSGPLQVLRYSPEGEIPVAPFLSVTFNQPMIPLGTLEDLAALEIPIQVEPALPGTWRWLGTKTLTFEYDSAEIDRLPKATEYRVTIPAGTKSMTGGVLAEAVTWTFTTPAVTAVSFYPTGDAQPLEPVFVIVFDQRIEPAAVLETVEVRAGGQLVAVKLASEEEIQNDKSAARIVKYALAGRWLAFRALEPLPADTGVTVMIGPDVPSAEGPRLSESAQSYGFSTYAPLRIEEHTCGWGDKCRPLMPFYIRFNNALNADAYTEEMLRVEPAIPGVSVNMYGNTLEIHGATQGQTTYNVTVSGGIQDVFGQTLGEDATLTFRVGKAEPLLAGPQKTLVTLDPQAPRPLLSVYAMNYDRLPTKVYAVQPTDWPDFLNYLDNWRRTDVTVQMPGRLVFDESIPVEAPADTLTEVDIDLEKYMDGAYGHFVVIVEPPKALLESDNDKWRRYSQTVITWVQITQIGLDAFVDHSEMVAWTTALKDGAPLSGVEILPYGESRGSQTSSDGLARFRIPAVSYLVARLGADQALLPHDSYYSSNWQSYSVSDSLRWFVFDDRQMYKPGEEVHIKGWLRLIGGRQDGDVGLVGDAISSVSYSIRGPQGNDLRSGVAEVNLLGGFDFAFTIPQAVNLGYATIELYAQGNYSLDGISYQHSFQIQEFRRPEFEVNARNETVGPYFAGGSAVLAAEAKYYAGDPLPNAETTWAVTYSPASYSPPNWPDFIFGTWQPWWWFDYGYWEGGYGGRYGTSGTSEVFNGTTDASGTHYLNLDFESAGTENPRPVSVSAQATVMDVNRQAWSGSTSLLVHPAELYVGLRTERYFVEKGDPIQVDVIVTDIDGNPVADRPVEVRAARLEWKYRGSQWQEVETDPQTCTLGSTLEPQSCTFETTIGGSYRITARVTDGQGRLNQSQMTRWVSGGERPPSRDVEQEEVTLIPDKETYQPGDTAQILVQSPFSPAEGLLTVTRSGILYTERFIIEDGTTTLNIPIEETHIPNLYIQVDLVGSAARLDDDGNPLPEVAPRPAFASGTLKLNIPPLTRTLALEVTPETRELEPGGETTLSVAVRDAAGLPVADAEVAVVVVDEAILALTNYQMADPLGIFYSERPSYLQSQYARSSIVLVNPLALAAEAQDTLVEGEDLIVEKMGVMEAPAAAMPTMTAESAGRAANDQSAAEPIRIRTDFNPLAVFAPGVYTDAEGMAQIAVKLPDNLTRYRIMVVAVDNTGRRFGQGESSLTARLPLMVRPSAPRFLNFGDTFELPVVLQNQTDADLEVDVVVQAVNLTLTEFSGLRVTVPAHNRVEVRFPAAAQLAGTARLQFAAVSGADAGDGYADAATVDLPVYTPATTEAFATYGVVDDGADGGHPTVFQPVLSPSGVFPQYGGLEINTSSTALQALTDAVIYLSSYPYQCSEQRSSRILAIAALRDVLSAFEADGLPSPEALEASVQRDIEMLQVMQNSDGGFPYWRRGFDSIPFNSIHVAHALVRAQEMDFAVPADMQQNALAYLRDIENHYPSWYGLRTRQTLSAYALYVRALSGDPDPQKASRLLEEAGLENLSLDAIGWLWTVIEDETQRESIRRFVGNRVVETAGAANFITDFDEENYLLLGSNRRTDAILLNALIADDPQSDLIPKIVNGLLAHRTRGHWGNTQENVFVLLALDRYFNTYETQTPDFVARLWLGDTYAGEFEFQGRTTERQEVQIPMSYVISETLAGGGTQNLILTKEGAGRLYYRLGLRYAPTDLNLPPLDMGFVVSRQYEAVDNPEDVYQDAEGVWHIQAGARVRVVVKMVADSRRYHVALVCPLPAGLEIVNPALAVSQDAPQSPAGRGNYYYGWWWYWFDHQNLRDERAEAFTPLLWEGVYEYSFIARATTPGTFIAPPAKAEEMYSPEVFGRSNSDWVVVEDR